MKEQYGGNGRSTRPLAGEHVGMETLSFALAIDMSLWGRQFR
jgi:hypothetical protein